MRTAKQILNAVRSEGVTDDLIEEVYMGSFDRYISPARCDDMTAKGWFFELHPSGVSGRVVRQMIREYLEAGIPVICGYVATKIRDYHDHFVISYQPEV